MRWLFPENGEHVAHLIDSQMAEAVKIMESAGLRPTTIEIGIPHQEILRVAEEENVSLIVCGRERKRLRRRNIDWFYHGQIVRLEKYPSMFQNVRISMEQRRIR